jgi:hypothetical protein
MISQQNYILSEPHMFLITFPSSGVYRLEIYRQMQLIIFQSQYLWDATLQSKRYNKIVICK